MLPPPQCGPPKLSQGRRRTSDAALDPPEQTWKYDKERCQIHCSGKRALNGPGKHFPRCQGTCMAHNKCNERVLRGVSPQMGGNGGRQALVQQLVQTALNSWGVGFSTSRGGGGFRKKAQLTAPLISSYDLWRLFRPKYEDTWQLMTFLNPLDALIPNIPLYFLLKLGSGSPRGPGGQPR